MYTEKDNKTVNVLGTEYNIIFMPADTDRLTEVDGLIDETVKEIIVGIFEPTETSVKDLDAYQRKVIRHEITHAFFYECGLAESSGKVNAWAHNEEMVDWIARQHNKIHAAFEAAGAL